MINGILGIWFFLTALSLIFLIYDLIKNTPALPIMKWAWVLVTLYTGPLGLFFYLLSCRQPLAGMHDKYIENLWKQSLGSEVHCLAGDATGIIAAAFVLSLFDFSSPLEVIIEYLAGFGFGLFIFQALFMKKAMGCTYLTAIKKTVMPEWLSMNMIMAGMIPSMVIWGTLDPVARNPGNIRFWGMMSLAAIVGGFLAYPVNRWLVKNGLKHGMISVGMGDMPKMPHTGSQVSSGQVWRMALYTLVVLALGILVAIVGHFLAS